MSAKNEKVFSELYAQRPKESIFENSLLLSYLFFSFSVFVTPPKMHYMGSGEEGRSLTKTFPKQKFMHLSRYMYVESFKYLSSIMKDFFRGRVPLKGIIRDCKFIL